MELKRLEVFEAIMRSGTVSAAARELGLTQSAVSRILARFEADLGFPLFRRAQGRLVPTARAHAVLVQVREVLAAVSGLRGLRSGDAARQRDALRFVTVPTLADTIMPTVLRSYGAAHPGARFAFDVRTTDAAVDTMLRREADFAVVALPVAHPTLRVTPLYRATSCCVLPRDHPLAAQAVISAADLRDVDLIVLGRRQPTRQLIEEAFNRAGVVPRVRVETSTVGTACRCVAAGLGVTVVNGLMAGYAADATLTIRPFEPRIHHTLALIEPAGSPRASEVAGFLRCLLADIEAMAKRVGIRLTPLGHSDSE
ncbi:MAG TPA: LysR family transcriptional regulator [Rhodobacteraceae bacterium]|jgi:DNA-binding transcriptional LysR family regulator|nr:LysR family transcriptional regulator [Paracoccaceae bacterium]HBG99642.1 LysR family transcriptional regulator [Paracoccaceae bacterium]